MKCEVCLELLEEYLDGEVAAEEQEQINAHLITCADCSASFAALTAEQELFARYDREVEVPPFLWTRIAAHTVSERVPRNGWYARFLSLVATPSFAGAALILLLAIAVGVIYLRKADPVATAPGTDPMQAGAKTAGTDHTADQTGNSDKNGIGSLPGAVATGSVPGAVGVGSVPGAVGVGSVPGAVATGLTQKHPKRRVGPATTNRPTFDQGDVVSTDLSDMEDRDTAKHIEQTQNLLRSIRNVQVSDGDDEIDISYDKALSRRLLNENVVLRRDAEMKAKFPTKTLLADVEPILIDIANLPDRARAEDVRAIKERVQKTEIVAALMGYQDRGTINR